MGIGGDSNTGGSGNGFSDNDNIHTGDASTHGVIINHVNTNIIDTGCKCTPTPGSSTPTPGIQPTATPTPGSNGGNNGGSGGGGSNSGGSSNSSSSSNNSTQAVLGASSMASTGTFMNNFMNTVLLLGIGFVLLGLGKSLRKKQFVFEIQLQY